MKKIFTMICAMAVSLSAMAVTFTFTSASSVSQTVDGITVSISKASGNNEPFFSDKGELRLYASNTITVSGADLTSMSLTFSKQGSKAYASLSASTGSLVSGGESTSNTDLKTDTWTGNAKSVTFTLGSTGQRIITKLVVNGDGSEGGDGPGDQPGDDTPDNPGVGTLDPAFPYPEPTMVLPPSTTVQGDAYSFVYNNVKVDCTKGAVTDKYFSAHAGFDMTFTAAKDIKGIVINGFVKKGFTADVDNGDISYLTPDEDIEADPVVVITDIDSKTVTISCDKQLRCYNVELYFDENPDVTVGGGSQGGGSGETINLVFDSAEAVYESEIVEYYGEENYSIFLYNAAEPDMPYFALDLWPASKDNLAGTYSWYDYTLGDYTYYLISEEEYYFAEDGEVTVSKSGNTYTINGEFLLEDGNVYTVSFKGEMPIYLDTDYYDDGDDDGDDDAAIDDVLSDTSDAPAYDLQGRKVGASYRGIVISNGKKIVR